MSTTAKPVIVFSQRHLPTELGDLIAYNDANMDASQCNSGSCKFATYYPNMDASVYTPRWGQTSHTPASMFVNVCRSMDSLPIVNKCKLVVGRWSKKCKKL